MNIRKFKNFESNSFSDVKTNVDDPSRRGFGTIKTGEVYQSPEGEIGVVNIYIDAWSEVPKVLVSFKLETGTRLEATEPYMDFIKRLRGKKTNK